VTFAHKLYAIGIGLFGQDLMARFVGPGLIALVIKIISAALSYIMLVSFARLMTPTAYGHFGLMLNLAIVLSSIACLGLSNGVMRFWTGHLARGERSFAQGFTVAAQRILLAVSVAMLIVGLALSYVGVGQSIFGMQTGALFVAALAGAFAFGDYYSSALRAQGKVMWSLFPRDILWRILATAAAFVTAHYFSILNAGSALLCCAGTMICVCGAQAIASRRAAHALTGNAEPQSNWRYWRKPLLPLAGASILYAMIQQLDVVVVGALLGADEAGAYFAAQKTASLLGLVMIAGGLVAAPLMSAAFQAGQRLELQRLCKLLAAAIALTTLLGLVGVAVFGKLLLSIFDPTYVSAYAILMVLALGYTIDAMAGPTAYLMQMTSLEGAYLRIMAIVYAFVLALQVVFVPIYGAIAAAAATAAGVCLWNIIAIRLLRKSIGVDSSILSFFVAAKTP
jgi:O-antigen/teichoic acid export membrane protein